jgi:nitrogen fixation NifU-like protein
MVLMPAIAASDLVADLYEDHLLAHAASVARRGCLPHPTHAAALRSPRCGDEVRIDLAIDDGGCVTAARFQARGCLISQAAASILCEFIEGRSVGDVRAMTPATALQLVQVPLLPARRECALLAYRCLRAMLAEGGG